MNREVLASYFLKPRSNHEVLASVAIMQLPQLSVLTKPALTPTHRGGGGTACLGRTLWPLPVPA